MLYNKIKNAMITKLQQNIVQVRVIFITVRHLATPFILNVFGGIQMSIQKYKYQERFLRLNNYYRKCKIHYLSYKRFCLLFVTPPKKANTFIPNLRRYLRPLSSIIKQQTNERKFHGLYLNKIYWTGYIHFRYQRARHKDKLC